MCRNYRALLKRFERFRQGRPAGEDLATHAAAFVAMLPVSCRKAARCALRLQFGAALARESLPVGRYHRDEEKLRRTVLSAADRHSLFAADLTARERAVLAVLYVVRRFEAAQLQWRDLDLDGGFIYVRRGKGGKPATTLLPPTVIPALREWRTVARPSAEDAPVFPGRWGGGVQADTVSMWVRRLMRRLGIYRAYRGPHALRRTFASVFLKQHPDQIVQLQRLMRHSNIGTTSLYVYLAPEDLRETVASLNL